jgi:hypothetical protein
MKRYEWITVFFLIAFLSPMVFDTVPSATAQNVTALGEIQTSGTVYIKSSDGRWVSAGPAYPLLPDTAIKTEEGAASIYFKDGSRVSLSKESAAIVDGAPGRYAVNLLNGVMVFNINPAASLSVATATANVTIGDNAGIVQKVAYEKKGSVKGSILGAITVSDKGTEVRSISGPISVGLNSSDKRLIASGESIFVDNDNKYKIYKTQAVGVTGEQGGGYSSEEKIAAGGITAAFIGGGIWTWTYAHRHEEHHVASPSTP